MKDTRVKLQTSAGAMTVPIILLVLVSFFVGIGSAFTDYIPSERNIPYDLLIMITNLGLIFMNNLQLRFAVAIAFILVKKGKGWAAFAGLISFFCSVRGIEGWITLEGWTIETTTIDALVKSSYAQQAASNFNALWSSSLGVYSHNMGIFPGIVTGLVAAGLRNKFIDTELPTMFGFFVGMKFVIIMVALTSIPPVIAFYYVWSCVVSTLQSTTGSIRTSDLLGTFVPGTLDKMLSPLGIHHPIAFPIEYTKVGGAMIVDSVVYESVKNIINGQVVGASAAGYTTRNFTNGRLLLQSAGLSSAVFAMYCYAKPENKKKVASLLASSVFMLTMVSIPEPIEYTFLLAAPALYWPVYALLYGLHYVVTGITNIFIDGTVLFFAIPNPFQLQKTHAMSALQLLPVAFIVYHFAFKFVITEFNLKTSDRDDEGEIKLMSEKEHDEIKDSGKDEANVSSVPRDMFEVRTIEAFGGADNIETVTCYASRLRATIKDDSLITPDIS